MERKWRWRVMALALALLGPASAARGQEGPEVYVKDTLRVECQTSGPFKVNSYLVYDLGSKEAALIDAGSSVDRLLAMVDGRALELRYVLLTHCHQDHAVGVPALKERFPRARFYWAKQESSDLVHYRNWRKVFDAASAASWEKDPAMAVLMDLDYSALPRPDAFLKDGRRIRLGRWDIRVIRTPGHSRGGLTFSVAGVVFPGDLLLYHATGTLDYPLCSKDGIVASIRKLYALLPDGTVICSGHGRASTIGYEKAHNKNVTLTQVTWDR